MAVVFSHERAALLERLRDEANELNAMLYDPDAESETGEKRRSRRGGRSRQKLPS